MPPISGKWGFLFQTLRREHSKEMEKRARKVAEKYPNKVEVAKFDALSEEGDKYGVLLTPTTVVNETVVATGSVPSEKQLEEIIEKEIGGQA